MQNDDIEMFTLITSLDVAGKMDSLLNGLKTSN